MEFYSFTFFVTDDCNFKCSYCYQKKGKKYIDISTIENALDFFLPFLKQECFINFYGGEPLLAFDQIRHAVDYIQDKSKGKKRQIQYSITTNGSLLNENILRFLTLHQFSLLLSFDGIAQDISRKRGSFRQIISIIGKLLKNPGLDLEINSVFTPTTIGYISRSIQYIIESGVTNVSISLCQISSWEPLLIIQLKEELASLRGFILSFYQKRRRIPLINFRKNSRRGVFTCFAGKDRLAMTPEGKLWGCHLFLDYFKGKEGTKEYRKYCFGDLNSFIENYEKIYPEVLSNYSGLRMDHFYTTDTFCIQCDELKECRICPMDNKLAGSNIRAIPHWACETNKIFRKEKRLFWKELERAK